MYQVIIKINLEEKKLISKYLYITVRTPEMHKNPSNSVNFQTNKHK